MCPRNVLPFKIHDNKVLNPYSDCSFLIPGLAAFARSTDRNLVVASERKIKRQKLISENKSMNPYQSLTKVYTQIGVWENWKNSIKTDVEKK